MEVRNYLKENYCKVDFDINVASVDTGYSVGSLRTIASQLRLKRNTSFLELENEKWKSLSFLGLSDYYISSYSRVKNKDGRLLLDSKHHQSGYHQIRLVDDSGNRKCILCHKSMYIAFHGYYDESIYECDHIDGDRDNNYIGNIELLTPSQNVRKQKGRTSIVVYLTRNEVIDICEKLSLGLSISTIAKTKDKYTKSRVEKIKQRIRWTDISDQYNF